MLHKINPATLEPVGDIPEDDLEAMGPMLQEARAAQAEWASWPLSRRRDALVDVQRKLIERWEQLAAVISQETGKPRAEAVNTDILAAVVSVDYSARSMSKLFAPQKVRFENLGLMMRVMGRRSYIRNRPLGVIGIIAPWNYPLGIPFSQTVMALAAGNAVVFKPAPETPLTALEMNKLFEGLPRGLVQTFVGGDEHGKALVTSGVDRIVFTGSSAVGSKIMAMAAQRLTPLTLELGGKDPCIVLDDADLERAAEGVVWGAFVNAGQTCVCIKRLYVQDGVYDRFAELLKAKVSGLRLGYGTEDRDADVGPLISEAALKRTEETVQQAVRDGGKVLVGGKRAPGLKGYFFEPTVIADAPQGSCVVQEEAFGPILTINRFSSEEEAVRLANDCPYALSGSVWSSDLERGRTIAERMSGGTILVNNVAYTYGLPMTPWGGKGMSGYGRTHGEIGFSELVEPHHVHVDDGRYRRDIWWHPYRWKDLADGTGLLDALYGSSYRGRLRAMLGLRKAMNGKKR